MQKKEIRRIQLNRVDWKTYEHFSNKNYKPKLFDRNSRDLL